MEQILDEEEEISLKEFEKFEEKLKKLKGEVPKASSLDTVE